MGRPLSHLFKPQQWLGELYQPREQKRTTLLCLRVREYFEDRERKLAGRASAYREQIIYEFEQRGYSADEVTQALNALVVHGVLQSSKGWYSTRDLHTPRA